MDKILPRKYNNFVVIGLGVALAVAIGVAVYLWMKQPAAQLPQHQHHPSSTPQAHPVKPEHVETRVGDGKPALVLVWAGWCGHSINFKPVWDKIASHLSKEGAIDAIDVSDEKNKNEVNALRPLIKGFPSILFFPEGFGPNKPSVAYEGNRTEEDVLKFAYQAYGA